MRGSLVEWIFYSSDRKNMLHYVKTIKRILWLTVAVKMPPSAQIIFMDNNYWMQTLKESKNKYRMLCERFVKSSLSEKRYTEIEEHFTNQNGIRRWGGRRNADYHFQRIFWSIVAVITLLFMTAVTSLWLTFIVAPSWGYCQSKVKLIIFEYRNQVRILRILDCNMFKTLVLPWFCTTELEAIFSSFPTDDKLG